MFGIQVNSFEVKNFFAQKIGKSTFVWKIIEFLQGVSYSIDYLLFYKFRLFKKSSITEINIEFVSYCNLRCKLCSLDHEKTKVRMSTETLKHFFEDLLTDDRFSNLKTIHLYNAGEVLLHPKLEEMLDVIKFFKNFAKEKNIHFPKIALLTNATILDEDNSNILIRSGILDNIRFSMDGGSKEKFEEMRLRAKWDDFVKNVTTFCELNKKSAKPIPTGIITLVEYENKLNTKWMSEEFKKLLNMVNGYELRYAHNWGGEVEIEELKNKNKKGFKIGCSLLMHQLVLLPNGDVTVCCADLNSKGVIGNILNDKLYAIYQKPLRLEMLRKFMKGKKKEIELCKDCETF
ncbi:MAG: SPASM domain-containing protein [Bacteroidetes bacterium]|nr:SPASM domain-containing protein [Bacteroidota bacterium]